MRLDGTVALVTGAGKRVGRAIALACAEAGADVGVHYRRSRADAEQVVAEIRARGRRATAIAVDLTERASAARLVAATTAELGGLDLLVNSAATFERVPFVGGDDAAWEAAWTRSLETNLVAPARLARAAAPALGARRGCIVNIIDVGAVKAWPSYAAHTASKAALAHLTRTLAVGLAPDVRVNGVSPGIAVFPDDMPDDVRVALIGKTALARPGTPEDIAEAVVFVATQTYTTGVILPVDGGWAAR